MASNKVILEDLEVICQSGIDWGRFSGKTVLITGANGFLPAYMAESLLYVSAALRLDIKVIAMVRNITKAKTRFADYADDKNLIFIEQDVSNPVNIATDIPVDFIVHAASQASPKYYGTDPVGTLSANVLGTINMVNLAKEKNVESFLYFSSGDVYGQVGDDHIPMTEDYYGFLDPTKVRSCYGESKRMGENICASWYHQYNVPAKMVRPFHTYGPKMLLDDGRVFADFVSDVLTNRDITLHSDGSARRAFCYLSDATIGFFMVLLNGKNGEAYNVGNPYQEHSILELAEIMVSLFPNKGLRVIMANKDTGNLYLKSPVARNSPAIAKIKELGWEPVISARDGFYRTVISYLAD